MKMDKVLLKRIKRKLNSILHKPINEIKANAAIENINQIKNENEIIIILTGAIGDSVYALAFVDALKVKKPEIKIVVYGYTKWKELYSSYSSIDAVKFIDSPELRKLGDIRAIYGSDKASEKGRKLGIINGNAFYYKKCYLATNPDIMYQLKTYIYDVGENANITYHGIKKGRYPFSETQFNKMDYTKTVVLNPYSGSSFEANVELYEAIAKVLIEYGYQPVTNVVGNQKCIKGTKPLQCTIYQLFDLCCRIPLIVSIRSGILDFVAPSNINMFVIYENCSERIKKMYHLKNWVCAGRITELYPQNIQIEKEKILSSLKDFIKNIM